jgi:hypothetical protein
MNILMAVLLSSHLRSQSFAPRKASKTIGEDTVIQNNNHEMGFYLLSRGFC